MFLFGSPFLRGLRAQAKLIHLTQENEVRNYQAKTPGSIDFDPRGFYAMRPGHLGELAAMLFAQAEWEGVTTMRLHYGYNRMYYAIEGNDYEMVPCPPPSNVDMVRALAKVSRLTWKDEGNLSVSFADKTLRLKTHHHMCSTDPYLVITGFSGDTSRSSARSYLDEVRRKNLQA